MTMQPERFELFMPLAFPPDRVFIIDVSFQHCRFYNGNAYFFVFFMGRLWPAVKIESEE